MSDKQLTAESAQTALADLIVPDFGKDIASLGILKSVRVRDEAALVTLDMPIPLFPEQDQLKHEIAERLRLFGATEIEFQINSVIRGKRPADKSEVLPDVKNVIAVASGKGGVGKSTLAVNLALSLAQHGAAVGLLDADVYGPSIGMMLGLKGTPEAKGENRILPVEAHGIKSMSIALFAGDDMPVIWRGPMVHGLIQQFLTHVVWGELDYLVIDLPPGTGDAQLTLTQSAPLSGAVIVSTPQDVSLIDARKGLRMFQQVNVPVLGMVENMSYFSCPHCQERTEIFRHGGGKSASVEMEIPFLGEVPLDPEVVLGGDGGSPIVSRNADSPAAKAYGSIAYQTAVALAKLALEGLQNEEPFFIEWGKDQ